MHTLQLQIDDSIFDKFMGLLELLPKEKIFINSSSNAISFEEAQLKVEKSIKNISNAQGLDFDEAFDKVLNS